jgi:outer membrane protein assembly factor BamB
LPTWPYADAGTPVVSAAGVHVSDSYALHALDADTGVQLWRAPELSQEPFIVPVVADPFVDGSRVLFSWGTGVGEGGAWTSWSAWHDVATGAPGAEVPTGPVTARRGDLLAAHTEMGSPATPQFRLLGVVDTGDPAASWATMLQVATLASVQQPTIGAHRIYHAGAVDTAYEPGARVTGVRAYPLASPTVCAEYPPLPTFSPIMCRLWEVPTAAAPVTSPVVGPGETAVYTGLADGTLLALDAATGAELWSAALGAAPSDEPALADGWLYVPLADGDLAVLDAATGAVAWRADVGGAGRQPAVAGRATAGATGVVFVGTSSGDLLAFAAAGCGAATCAPLWAHDLGAPVTGAPTVRSGRVHVGLGPPAQVAAFALDVPGG